MTPAFAATLVLLGFAGAFVAGLVGVGGAIVLIPLLYYVPAWLGVGALDIRDVAGVTMAEVLAATVLGAAIHGRAGAVHPRLAAVAGGSMAAAALAGAVGSRWVSGRALLVIFGLMGTVACVLMALPPVVAPDGPVDGPVRVDRRAAVYPAAIGLVSGLVGAGGAFLLMPVLIGVLGVPIRLSIGTSLAITGVSALAGFVGKVLTHQVPLWPTVAVVGGSLGGVTVGARLSRRAPTGVLRACLGVLIALVTLGVWVDVLSR